MVKADIEEGSHSAKSRVMTVVVRAVSGGHSAALRAARGAADLVKGPLGVSSHSPYSILYQMHLGEQLQDHRNHRIASY